MKLDAVNGNLTINKNVNIYRGMTKSALLDNPVDFEIWIEYENIPVAYRKIFSRPAIETEEIILIVFLSFPSSLVEGWHFGPTAGTEGLQKHPEGRYTKIVRRWFLKNFAQNLPLIGDWGCIDASHDPHNLTTSIICDYKL